MLLRALSYIVLIAAFFLPWTVGEIVRSAKAHDKQKLTRWCLLCGVCVLLIICVVILAFALNGAAL